METCSNAPGSIDVGQSLNWTPVKLWSIEIFDYFGVVKLCSLTIWFCVCKKWKLFCVDAAHNGHDETTMSHEECKVLI